VTDAVKRRAEQVIERETSSLESVFTLAFGKDGAEDWRTKIIVLLSTVALMTIAAAVDIGMGGQLHKHGIHPRTLPGLWGIPIAPFLHVTLSNMVMNALPFVILGFLVLMRPGGIAKYAYLVGSVAILAGLGVWAFGEDQLHIGSSVLVFGFFGYTLVNGFIRRDWRSVIIACVTGILYGPTLVSVFTQAMGPNAAAAAAATPGADPVSWMYMALGAAAGSLFSAFENSLRVSGLGFVEFVAHSVHGGRSEAGSSEERESLKGGGARV